jgi:hypothetical protein
MYQCPICLDEYTHDKLKILICGHKICYDCEILLIENGQYKLCPLCRTHLHCYVNFTDEEENVNTEEVVVEVIDEYEAAIEIFQARQREMRQHHRNINRNRNRIASEQEGVSDASVRMGCKEIINFIFNALCFILIGGCIVFIWYVSLF